MVLLSRIVLASSISSAPHHSRTFLTIDEPTLAHYHPKSIIYIGARLAVVPSMGLDKCMTCIRHYSIIQGSFTALNEYQRDSTGSLKYAESS